jgi:hypothetical protein
MRARSRLLASGLAVALVAVGCTGEPEPRREDEVDVGECRFRPTGDRIGDVPAGMDGVVADDLWVVGARYRGGSSEPYASRWDGQRWNDAPVADLEAEIGGFHDVAAASGRAAWAVGSTRAREPIAFSWDGARWSSDPIASLEVEEAELFGVTAAGRSVWAVGRERTGRRWSALVMERRGGAWRRAAARSPGGVDATLRGVDAAAPNDVWAVGWTAGPGGRLRTFAMHHDGTSWQRVPTPGSGGDYDILAAVDAVSADESWAVGWAIDAEGIDRPLVLRWDGDRWSSVAVPELPGRAQLTGVSVPLPDHVWIAGRIVDETQTFASLVLRWDGRSWSTIRTPDVGAEDDTIASIAVVDGFPWIVGSSLGVDQKYRSLLLSGC